jgi:hypothetical protein
MPTILINNKQFPISEIYQNVYGSDIKPERDCWERMKTILTADRSFNDSALEHSTVCDVGSNLGYFLFKLAETSKERMIGIEIDKNAYNIACEINKYKNQISFINAQYQDADIGCYESFLCLSIFHHGMNQGLDFLNRISSHAKTIYVEQATHLEYAYFGKHLTCGSRNPFHYWLEKLDTATNDLFNIRLIGVHKTHLNTIRPMYQLKRKIAEKFVYYGDGMTSDMEFNIYDKWNVPYIDFGSPRVNDWNLPVVLPRKKQYLFAEMGGQHYFIKILEDKNKLVTLKHEGFLLSDILKFGMLPFYDRTKLKEQIADCINFNHADFVPWNIIVNENSKIFLIDGNDNPGFIPQKQMIDMIINML